MQLETVEQLSSHQGVKDSQVDDEQKNEPKEILSPFSSTFNRAGMHELFN